ncbi:MAG: hypothetical protein QXT45_07960 [Candidatus Bilamarchaeaceae archaeon]
MALASKKTKSPQENFGLTQCYLAGHDKIRLYFSCDCGRLGRATEVEKSLSELATQIDGWGDYDIHEEATLLAELRGLEEPGVDEYRDALVLMIYKSLQS